MRELVREWARRPDGPQFVLCAPGAQPTDMPVGGRISWCAPNPVVSRLGMRAEGGRLWLNSYFSLAARLARPDVLFFPWSVVPSRLSSPAVVTVHDVCFRSHQQYFADGGRAMDTRTGVAVRTASQVVAVSQACKDAVVATYGVDAARITVVHHGISGIFTPVSAASEEPEIAHEAGISGPYVLCVSTHEPRKNLDTLVRAFGTVLAEWPASSALPSLVMVGRTTPYTAELRALAAACSPPGQVQFVEGVSDTRLAALYRGAHAVAVPSTCEGFGFPLIEALASGSPVIASDLPVFRELVGDAAHYVPPLDQSAWADSLLTTVMARSNSKTSIVERFTWARAAERTLEVLYRAAV
ncbi:MAG: glycosyltransferase family 4 protein [Chloroflexi bacterium]|nr:glycosyltransferase family 4 protein [Chloroflexota bacterium]